MGKKTLRVLICCLLLVPFAPTAGWSHHHGGAALAWGLTGFFLGSVLTSIAYRPPAVVYAAPPLPAYYAPPPITTYAPAVPPGMCRWERYVLDQYGRTLLDRSGNPIKEYTLGSCQYPPY